MDKALEKVLERYTISSGYWQPLFDYWRDLIRNYYQELSLAVDSETGEKLYPYRSKFFSPMTFEKMETILPQLVDSVFDKDPFFRVIVPPGHRDFVAAKKTEILLRHQLRERRFKEEAVPMIKQAMMIGTQILRLRWKYEAQYFNDRNTVRLDETAIGILQQRMLKETYDGPDIVRVPFYNFFIDPYTPPCKLQSARYCMETFVQSWNDFKEDAEYYKYKNLSEVRRLVKQYGTSISTEDDERAIPDDPYSNDVQCIMYMDKDSKGGGEIIYVATAPGVHNKGVIIKRQSLEEQYPDREYPYINLHTRTGIDQGVDAGNDAVADYKPGGFYPIGDLHPLHGLQALQNTHFNQRVDMVTLGLNPPLIVSGGGLEDEEKLNFNEPGSVVHAKSDLGFDIRSQIYQVPIVDNFGNAYGHHMNMITDMADRALGVHDTIAGKEDSSNRTATGTVILTENAMKRFSMKVFILAKGLERMLVKMSEMNAEMIDPDTLAYIEGSPEPIVINPEDVVRGVSFNIHTSPFYAKQIRADQAMALIPQMMQSMPFGNLSELWRIILDNMEFIDDSSGILPNDMPPVTPLDIMDINSLKQVQQQLQIMKGNALYGGGMGGTNGQTTPAKQPQGVAGTSGTQGNVQKIAQPGFAQQVQQKLAEAG